MMKKRRKRLDLVQLGSVLTAAGPGSSNRHIAKQMGVGESTIRAIRKRYRDRGVGAVGGPNVLLMTKEQS